MHRTSVQNVGYRTGAVRVGPPRPSGLNKGPDSAAGGDLLEVVDKLAAAMTARYQAIIVLGAGTGVRIGEALGLTVDRVDWLRRTMVIDRQLITVREGQPIFGPVKHVRNRPRTIPCPT